MAAGATAYPGALAAPRQVLALASEYHKASEILQTLHRPGKPLTRAPFRLSALQALELYLNALLLHRGHRPEDIRAMRHDLWARAELAAVTGLHLRTRTAAHLKALGERREYLVTRYGPELAASTTEVNRLTATLQEVARKVAVLIEQPGNGPALHGR
jgi:hypothetical protein